MHFDHHVAAGAKGCGELLMVLQREIRRLQPGQVLRVETSDPAAPEEIPAWCRLQGHRYLGQEQVDGNDVYYVQKGSGSPAP